MVSSASDALAAFKKGKKASATGFLKWNADHGEAVIQFEKAAKIYKEQGLKKEAQEAFLCLAKSAEAVNELYTAGDAYMQAASMEKDQKKQMQMIDSGYACYQVHGTSNKAQSDIKKMAQNMIQSEKRELGLLLYEKIFDDVFTGDNYMYNPEIVSEFTTLLVEEKEYFRAMKVKRKFIAYMKKERTIDHQIRRAWLEIICLSILADEVFKCDQLKEEFNQEGCAGSDEFRMASAVVEEAKKGNWAGVSETLKKPLFQFIELTITKNLKLMMLQKAETPRQEEKKQMNEEPDFT